MYISMFESVTSEDDRLLDIKSREGLFEFERVCVCHLILYKSSIVQDQCVIHFSSRYM